MMKLLSDDTVRQFIVDGCISLEPDVDDEIHATIDRRLRRYIATESHLGNNVVSRIPIIWDVLRCSVIRGAITSLLGPNYYVHPHRAIHTSTPVEDKTANYPPDFNGPPMGKGSRAGSGWHQDAQSPLSRPRYHTPKFLIGFYFPHETPELMGPTRFQAGSYLYSETVAPSGVVLNDCIAAGTFLLLHFDTVHAGWPNRTETSRHMLKFIFTRTDSPQITWDHRERDWQMPTKYFAERDLSPAWQFNWNWMRDVPHESQDDAKVADLNSTDQEKRIAAIYGRYSSSDIATLIDRILGLRGQGRENRRLAVVDKQTIARDNVHRDDRRWNERAIVFDDAAYALAASDPQIAEDVVPLLASDDPWIVMNALFVLGELGPRASHCVPFVRKLLSHPLQQVVRTAVDALTNIGSNLESALDPLHDLIRRNNTDWLEPQVMRGWHGQDQVRLNIAFCLLSAINFDNDVEKIERILVDALKDSNGYVAAVAVEALTRIGTTNAQAHVIGYLQDRRWDESITIRRPF